MVVGKDLAFPLWNCQQSVNDRQRERERYRRRDALGSLAHITACLAGSMAAVQYH